MVVQHFVKLEDLKAAQIIERVLGHKGIAISGHCDKCGKHINNVVTVSSSETPREAFDWFWYSLSADCTRE